MTKQPSADEREAMVGKAGTYLAKYPTAFLTRNATKRPYLLADFALAVLRDREAEAVRAAFEKVEAKARELARMKDGDVMFSYYRKAMDAVLREYEGGESDV